MSCTRDYRPRCSRASCRSLSLTGCSPTCSLTALALASVALPPTTRLPIGLSPPTLSRFAPTCRSALFALPTRSSSRLTAGSSRPPHWPAVGTSFPIYSHSPTLSPLSSLYVIFLDRPWSSLCKSGVLLALVKGTRRYPVEARSPRVSSHW
jgi:hypothetical protein